MNVFVDIIFNNNQFSINQRYFLEKKTQSQNFKLNISTFGKRTQNKKQNKVTKKKFNSRPPPIHTDTQYT